MKTAGPIFAILVALTQTLAAQTTDPVPVAAPTATTAAPATDAPKLSAEVSQVLTEKLPKYAPPALEPPKLDIPGPVTDPDVLELPKVTVTQKKRPRLTDQVMMTTNAFNEKLAKEKLSSFDRNFLNKFALPTWLSGVSAAQRAREEYDREQRAQFISDVARMAKVAEQIDPAQAKAMQDAANKP